MNQYAMDLLRELVDEQKRTNELLERLAEQSKPAELIDVTSEALVNVSSTVAEEKPKTKRSGKKADE